MDKRLARELAATTDPAVQAAVVIGYLDRHQGIAGVREFHQFAHHRVKDGQDPGITALAREFFRLRDKRLRIMQPERPLCQSHLVRRARPRGAGRPARRGSRVTRAGPDGDSSDEPHLSQVIRRRRALHAARGPPPLLEEQGTRSASRALRA